MTAPTPEHPPSGHESPANGAAWLTTSQAAVLLRVSEKTVQRRAAAGKFPSRKETRESGVVLLVHLETPEGDDKVTTPLATGDDRVTTGGDTENQSDDTVTTPEPEGVTTGDDISPASGDRVATHPPTDATERLIAHLELEKAAWMQQAQAWQNEAEEARRAAAQSLAALRDLQRQMKALPSPSEEAPQPPQDARIEAYAPINDAAGKEAPEGKAGAKEGSHRGSGLRDLRGAILKMLGAGKSK